MDGRAACPCIKWRELFRGVCMCGVVLQQICLVGGGGCEPSTYYNSRWIVQRPCRPTRLTVCPLTNALFVYVFVVGWVNSVVGWGRALYIVQCPKCMYGTIGQVAPQNATRKMRRGCTHRTGCLGCLACSWRGPCALSPAQILYIVRGLRMLAVCQCVGQSALSHHTILVVTALQSKLIMRNMQRGLHSQNTQSAPALPPLSSAALPL